MKTKRGRNNRQFSSPQLRHPLGSAARARVMEQFNMERIGSLQEVSYRRAIAQKKATV